MGTGVHIGLIGLLLVSALEFRWLTDVTLRGEGRDRPTRRPTRTLQLAAWGAISIGLLLALSYIAIEGATFIDRRRGETRLSRFVDAVSDVTRADLYQAEAWPKPPGWTGTKQQVDSAKEVDFSRRNFRRAVLVSCPRS